MNGTLRFPRPKTNLFLDSDLWIKVRAIRVASLLKEKRTFLSFNFLIFKRTNRGLAISPLYFYKYTKLMNFRLTIVSTTLLQELMWFLLLKIKTTKPFPGVLLLLLLLVFMPREWFLQSFCKKIMFLVIKYPHP